MSMIEPLNEIRVAVTLDGEIEAAFKYRPGRILLDRQTGSVIRCDFRDDSDEFRWLKRRAQEVITQ